jgi:hypothetical protein
MVRVLFILNPRTVSLMFSFYHQYFANPRFIGCTSAAYHSVNELTKSVVQGLLEQLIHWVNKLTASL